MGVDYLSLEPAKYESEVSFGIGCTVLKDGFIRDNDEAIQSYVFYRPLIFYKFIITITCRYECQGLGIRK